MQEIVQFAKRQNINFRKLFEKYDRQKRNLIKNLYFERVLKENNFNLSIDELKNLNSRYKQGSEATNYDKFQNDLCELDKEYANQCGELDNLNKNEPSVETINNMYGFKERNINQLLEDLADKITKRFSTIDEWCTSIDLSRDYLSWK